jgi:hypothetical protein
LLDKGPASDLPRSRGKVPRDDRQIGFGLLADWLEGRLPADEARSVEEAVAAADGDTLADVAWLRRFFEATESAIVESPPPWLEDTLVATFEDHTRGRPAPGLFRRMLAGLTFDSNLQPAAGLRAVGGQQARRQLIYQAEVFDLALNFMARDADSDLDIDGQVFPHEDGEQEILVVQLLRDGEELALTVTDELGSFAFRRVEPGRYELVLGTEGTEVSISPVVVSL